MALIQRAFSDIITFSRSSNATRVGPTGLVEYAPHNLLVRSQEFDNASWVAFNSGSVTANAGAAPDGTITADLFTWTSANASGIYQNLSSAFICTFSVFAKTVSGNPLIGLQDDTGTRYGFFNLSTGAVGSSAGLSASSITSVGNGWYRCVIVFASAPSSPKFINGAGAAGSALIWGAQLSVGPNPLDYTPTTSAAVYGPRFDYDPVTLAARGLLVEESRTNLVTYSEQFDNAAWIKSNVTVSANATTSPDGTINADKLIENAGSGSKYVNATNTNLAATATVSFFAKAAERNFVMVFLQNTAGSVVWYNLATGTVGTNQGSATATSIVPFGNGWYRCIATFPSVASNDVCIGVSSADNTFSYTGNGTSGLFVWGAQLEAGSFATSLIPTLASTVTRSADVASVNTLSPWYNQTEGSIFAEASGPLSGTDRIIIEGGTASDFRDFSLNFANLNAQFTPRYATGTFDVTSPNLTANSTAKLAASYSATSADLAYNGLLATTKTSVTQRIPADRIFLGSRFNSSLVLNGHIRRIAYYPRRLTNAELQALTA